MVGIKSREVYETPAATCLIEAHTDLEKMVHTKHQNKFKSIIDDEWSYLYILGSGKIHSKQILMDLLKNHKNSIRYCETKKYSKEVSE